MKSTRNTRIAAAGVVAVALTAAGAAMAASKLHGSGARTSSGAGATAGSLIDASSGTHRFGDHGAGLRGPGGPHGGLSAAASYLGISESDLISQLRNGKTLAQIANATSGKSAGGLVDALVADAKKDIAGDVSSGRLTQTQADAILKDLKQRITDRVDNAGPLRGPDGHGPGHGHGPGDDLAAAATYLGLSQSALIAKLQSGTTLGAIADTTSGKSKAGLVAALVAHEKAELTQAVKDGNLTQAQADEMASGLPDRFTRLVEGTLPSRHDGPPGAPMMSPEHI